MLSLVKTYTVKLSLPEYALRIANLYTKGTLPAASIVDLLAREPAHVAAYLAVAIVSYLPDSGEQEVRNALAFACGYD